MAATLQFNATQSMGEVVILTSSRRVAKWARTVAHVRGDFGSRLELSPVVMPITGKAIEALLDEAQPELAFFAAWAVRGRRGPEAQRVVLRAGELTERLPEPLREAAMRAILAVLREPLLSALREIAMNPDQLPETHAARRFRKFFEGRGIVEGQRASLLTILAARALTPTAEEREAITACTDTGLLDQWIARAVTAGSVAEVLSGAQPPEVR